MYKGIITVIIVLLFGILYSGYLLNKRITYSLSYERMVKQTIIEMVKPESLK